MKVKKIDMTANMKIDNKSYKKKYKDRSNKINNFPN